MEDNNTEVIKKIEEIKLMKIGEVMKALRISKRTVYNWIENGNLEATKLGDQTYRITEASVLKIVNEGLNKTPRRKIGAYYEIE